MRKTEWGFTFRATEDIVKTVEEFAVNNGFTVTDALRYIVINYLKDNEVVDENTARKMWVERRNWRRK